MQYVEAGSPCVIFHQFLPPLADAAQYLIENKLATRIGGVDICEIP